MHLPDRDIYPGLSWHRSSYDRYILVYVRYMALCHIGGICQVYTWHMRAKSGEYIVYTKWKPDIWQLNVVISKLGSNNSRWFILPLNNWPLLANIWNDCYYFFAKRFAIICYNCTRAQNINYCNYSNLLLQFFFYVIIIYVILIYRIIYLYLHCNYSVNDQLIAFL